MDSDDDETGSNTADHFIRHVTVRQLLEADQMHSTAPFKIEDKEFKKFILVANICYLDECETYRDIGLDDGTGRIKAREWDENEILERKSNRKSFQVSNFPYVHVVGELEQYRNRNTIKVMDIEAVTNAYEPYYHVLHAVHDTLVYERGPPVSHIHQS
ncbi:hypothetical protein BDZ94DRAFT_467240 [Collybia nuda]|uniref:Uncharacterized protein n=1 Tax=Collybia nuda TaxID=64659 RepID=A0A9P6CLI0_9AGAR|nr:hypothetical protein BDZ94DRAFT_467240 [Collybia nuda]